MKYVVTGVAGIFTGAAAYELCERLQWTGFHQRALVWAFSMVAIALACSPLWP